MAATREQSCLNSRPLINSICCYESRDAKVVLDWVYTFTWALHFHNRMAKNKLVCRVMQTFAGLYSNII